MSFPEALEEPLGWFIPPNVSEWPLRARRAFVLTLPLSGALWLSWAAAYAAWLFIWITVLCLLIGTVFVLSPFVFIGRGAWEFVGGLWSERDHEERRSGDTQASGMNEHSNPEAQ